MECFDSYGNEVVFSKWVRVIAWALKLVTVFGDRCAHGDRLRKSRRAFGRNTMTHADCTDYDMRSASLNVY